MPRQPRGVSDNLKTTNVQRPSRRRGGTETNGGSRFTELLAYLPLIGKLSVVALCCALAFALYNIAVTASIFQLRKIDIKGVNHSSAEDIRAILKRASRSGVWQTDLLRVRNEIERQGWIKSAVVTRVLPDGLRVRVEERRPAAIVRTSSGLLLWVDDDAIVLGAVSPSDSVQNFFIRGWDEAETEVAQKDNKERIKKYLEMQKEWASLGITERISEVDLIDVRDVRVELSGKDSEVEVRLGRDRFGERLSKALTVLDEQRKSSRGQSITRVDATQESRIIVAFGTSFDTTPPEVPAKSPEVTKKEKKDPTARHLNQERTR
jgi:cell division septal protein FtsQ